MIEETYTVKNLHCSACANVCTLLLKKIPGLGEVTVDEKTGATRIRSDHPLDLAAANALLAPKGYEIVK